MMRPETQKAFNQIVDTFSNAGLEFINFMSMIRGLDEQAGNGDQGAKQILDIMFRFNRLIEVASDPKYQKKSNE